MTVLVDDLVSTVWQNLVGHVGNAVEHTSKQEHVDCFSHLMTSLKELVQLECFAPNVKLVLLASIFV